MTPIRFARHHARLLVTLGFALAAGGAAVYATIPDSAGVISACYVPASGALHLIDPAVSSCNRGEQPLSWRVAGATGPVGSTGAAGPEGSPGRDSVSASHSQRLRGHVDSCEGQPTLGTTSIHIDAAAKIFTSAYINYFRYNQPQMPLWIAATLYDSADQPVATAGEGVIGTTGSLDLSSNQLSPSAGLSFGDVLRQSNVPVDFIAMPGDYLLRLSAYFPVIDHGCDGDFGGSVSYMLTGTN